MRFLVDAQLPPALAQWLSAQGCPADHVADLGMEAAPDRVIWEWASQEGVAIVTKDEDFAIWRIASSAGTSNCYGVLDGPLSDDFITELQLGGAGAFLC
jgi:predicted nuclease of predicted toxin-antitoxin system